MTGPPSPVAGLDLHLDRAGGRVRDSVMDAVRDAIRSGRLVSGDVGGLFDAFDSRLHISGNAAARPAPH